MNSLWKSTEFTSVVHLYIKQNYGKRSLAHRWVWCKTQGRPGSHRWGSCWWSEGSSDSLSGNQPVVTLAEKHNSIKPTSNYMEKRIVLPRGEKLGKVCACLCLKRPAAIHKGQSLSLCMFRGIFSFTHQCFFFKIRGNHDHLSFFCCLSFFLSLVR